MSKTSTNTKKSKRRRKDITATATESNGAALIAAPSTKQEKKAAKVEKQVENKKANDEIKVEAMAKDEEIIQKPIAEENKDQQKLAEDKSFRCPVCHTILAYGTKQCPNCGSKIFYRDMSHTFWNERKIKLLQQSGAISHD